MKPFVLSWLLIVLSQNTFCQNEYILKLTPLNSLHFETPIFPIGLEFRHKRLGLEYEHGLRIPNLLVPSNNDSENRRYFRSRLQLKCYLGEYKFLRKFFLLSASFLPQKYQEEYGHYIKNGLNYNYKNAEIRYINNVVYIGIGTQFSLTNFFDKVPLSGRPFRFEISAGFGVRERIITYKTESEILTNEEIMRGWFLFGIKDIEEGKFFVPSLLFNFRFCYMIPRKSKNNSVVKDFS